MKKLITALSVAGLCTLPLMGQAAAYKEVAVSNGGTITGKVTLAGKDLAPKKYKVSKDNAVCNLRYAHIFRKIILPRLQRASFACFFNIVVEKKLA